LIDGFDAAGRRIERLRLRAADRGDAASLHELRVGLKRMSAFFLLMGDLGCFSDADGLFRPFRRVFRAAGKVRSLQVAQERLRAAMIAEGLELSALFNILHGEERRVRPAALRTIREFDASLWTDRSRRFRGRLSRRGAGPFRLRCERLARARLDGLTAGPPPEAMRPADFHELRIRARFTRETLEILSDALPLSAGGRVVGQALRRVYASLGRWHDGVLMIRRLEGFLEAGGASLEGPGDYQALIDALERDCASDLREFEAAWTEFLALVGKHPRLFAPARPRRGFIKDSSGLHPAFTRKR